MGFGQDTFFVVHSWVAKDGGFENMRSDSKSDRAAHGPTRRWVVGVSLLVSILLGTTGGVAFKRLRAKGHDGIASQAGQGESQGNPSGKKCVAPVKLAELPEELVTDATKPGYDTQALRRSGVSAKAIFESQPDGTQWAKDMQTLVGAQFIQDVRAVVPECSDPEFVCKSAGCSLSWTPLGGDLDKRIIGLALLASLGPSMGFGNDRGRKTVYFLYPTADRFPVDAPKLKEMFDTSDPKKFAAAWNDRRRTRYAGFSQAKKPMGLPADYVALLRSGRLPLPE
jgi:hypothetical protein